jgi:hypothetical protein
MVRQGTSTSLSAPTPANQPSPRQVIPLDHPTSGAAVEVKVQAADPADSDKPLIVDEIGLFASTLDINSLFGGYEIRADQRAASVDFVRCLLLVTIALSIALALAGGPSSRAWVAGASGLAVGLAALVILVETNGPEWAADLRLMISAAALLEFPGANLNYGMYLTDSVMGGHGPIVNGSPMWNRMPGYPYFLALSWAPNDLLLIGLRSIFLQIGLLMVGLATLTFALARLVGPGVAALVGAILAIMPATPYFTLLDAAMPGIAYLVLAAGCNVITAEARGRSNRLLPHVLLHAAFALWFSFRVDVLPGWAAVSFFLYAWPPRRWRLAAIPVLFLLAIGLPWAIFKQQFFDEFSMTTHSSGASLMVGLWEIPHPFIWIIADAAYFDWVREWGFDPVFTKAASDWATSEVVRFWFTFPGYMVALIWNKFTKFIFEEITPGRNVIPDLHFAGLIAVSCLTIMLIALLVWHRPRRLLLLGWIILFNTPIFFLTYSSLGRFYNTALPSLIVTTAVLLVDRTFYSSIMRRPLRAGIAISAGVFIWYFAIPLADWMAHSDEFRFKVQWADPAKSTLVRWARPLKGPAEEAALDETAKYIDLAALEVAPEAERIAGTRAEIRARRPERATIASLDLTDALKGFANCRVRVSLTLRRGAIAAGVRAGTDQRLLAIEPVARASWLSMQPTMLDFNVPLLGGAKQNQDVLSLYFASIDPTPADVKFERVVVYDCTG